MRGDLLSHAVRNASLRPCSTLRAGGPADLLLVAQSLPELTQAAVLAHEQGIPLAVIGWGSNILVSDAGFRGLVVVNRAVELTVEPSGRAVASTGISLQELFLKCAQKSLAGLEFAVGIPGSLGGALASNAGAYRSGISTLVMGLEVVQDGEVQWVDPSRLEFGYRDSLLRRPNPPRIVVTQAELQLERRSAKAVYDLARENQRQRIGRQPPSASAGSFFKNVVNEELAGRIPGLTDGMRKAGVVPAGFLIEQAGLKGLEMGGARVHPRHANFLVNTGGATASAIRALADEVKRRVRQGFGVDLEEEVLYFGDWS